MSRSHRRRTKRATTTRQPSGASAIQASKRRESTSPAAEWNRAVRRVFGWLSPILVAALAALGAAWMAYEHRVAEPLSARCAAPSAVTRDTDHSPRKTSIRGALAQRTLRSISRPAPGRRAE